LTKENIRDMMMSMNSQTQGRPWLWGFIFPKGSPKC